MDIVEVMEGNEALFLAHAREDPVDNYFFLLDWTHEREKAKIHLAMDGDVIAAMCLVYKDSIVQLRGRRDAVETLLDGVDIVKVEMLIDLEHKDLVIKRYEALLMEPIMVMKMRKGQETPVVRTEPVDLGPGDAGAIAAVLRKANPVAWGDSNHEGISDTMKRWTWVGIREEGEVVGIGATTFTDFGSNIFIIAVDEAHRCKGHASSMVSALVKRIFERSELAIIHVKEENPAAIKAYTRVGFRPHKRYFFMKHGKRK